MAVEAAFTGFDPYKLSCVRVTDQKLGCGSYATVLELEYMGLKCAGKKIHELLLEQGDASYTIRRFEEECHLLSRVRHPNIVQFLGVFFQEGVQAPILIMEFLPTSLTSCIGVYGILPKEISYSILHDVALGLCYLHSQDPAIIHRDLSSNNVLLAPNMMAKICDLGVARILNMTALQASRMTGAPGTPAYMPPEVCVADPKYDTSIDEFSYGILMIHMFSGKWPEPQVGPSRTESDGRLIPITEAERRAVFLQDIGNDHPLMDLIKICISNDPGHRAHASEIVKRLAIMVLQFPTSYTNQLEMLQCIEKIQEQNKTLTEEKDTKIQQKEQQILSLKKDAQQRSEEIDALKMLHSNELKQMELNIRDLSSQNEFLKANNDAELTEYETNISLLNKQLKETEEHLHQEKSLSMTMAEENNHFKSEISWLQSEISGLQSQISKLKADIDSLQHVNSQQEDDLSRKDAAIVRKRAELGTSAKSLQEKGAIISDMNNQLTRVREHLAAKKQALQVNITWKQCAELPTRLSGMTTVINGKVYCGGGAVDSDDDRHDYEYIVYCYDPSYDRWTTLPPLPVKYFGLGQLNSKLVAVGGEKKSNDAINDAYMYDERAQKWLKQRIPSMPTARHSPGVISLQSALVVAGGAVSSSSSSPPSYKATVEILKPNTSQWYETEPLPIACEDISVAAAGNTCYALGGYNGSLLNQALYASGDDLFRCVHHSGNSSVDIQSAWKTLPNTPTYGPAAAVLAGNLLAIGGKETSELFESISRREVYMCSPSSNSWIYISDLPAPRVDPAVAVLSSTEILVIGGYCDCDYVNTVYKGTLYLN